jgi:hypothetical protein
VFSLTWESFTTPQAEVTKIASPVTRNPMSLILRLFFASRVKYSIELERIRVNQIPGGDRKIPQVIQKSDGFIVTDQVQPDNAFSGNSLGLSGQILINFRV